MAGSGFTPISVLVSDTASQVPTTSELTVYGEIAVNVTDKKIFCRDNANNIVTIADYSNVSTHNHTSDDITDIDTYIQSQARPSVRTETSTAWTLALTDEYHLILCDNASAITVTVPTNASVACPIGYTCHLHQEGAGQVTIAGDVGVTVNSARSLSTDSQYSALSLMKVATDQWVVIGDQQ